MDEDPAVAEIPSVSKVDTADYVETDEPPKLIELKPVSYDLGDVPNNNTDAFDRMDIDNHNVDFDQEDGKTTSVDDTVVETSDPNSVDESVDAKESTPKVNGVLKHSGTVKKADKKPVVTSPSSTPGKSRYGRVRKPKLSTDFVSMDRKSYAVLSNTSSYEHVYADETPRKAVVVKKPRKSSAKNSQITPSEPAQSVESLTKQSDEETSCKAENESVDETDTPKTVESSSNTPKPDEIISNAPKLAKSTPKLTKSTSQTPKLTKSTSQTPKPTKTASKSPRSAKSKTPKPPKEDLTEPSVSPVISKDPIKTYSRKGESSAAASVTEDNQTEKIDEEKLSQISHVELNWKVGDVAWAKIGCYSYWPSIVTLEYGSSIYVKSVGNRRLAVHVQFFGDRGRRSWVLTTSLIKYQSKEQFFDLKKQYKKDKIRFKYFVIKSSFQDLWEKAVTEADTVLKLPHEERIPYYQSLYPIAEKNFVDETSSLKSKRAMIRKSKNPEERRGRKRKILNDAPTTSALKKPRQTASESGPSGAGDEKLPNTETSAVKKRQPIDEHVKKRRAFMRRMNKILSQSNNNGSAKNKKPKNGLKQGGKNAKFNKLLDKENERKKQQKLGEDQTASSSTSPDSDPKKKDISVYDFESDEETDVFIGTYNSRFTPQILAKIEEEKAAVKDESKEPSTAEPESELSVTDDSKAEDGNLSNNEIKARRLFADDKKQPKDTDHVRPKGTASKFSKLFEQRHSATGRGRGRPSKISAHRSKLAHAKAARKIIRKKGAQSKAPPPEILPVEKKDTDDEREVGDFNAFRDQMTESVSVEHPDFNEEQVEDHLEKLWSEMDDAEKIKYVKVERESSSDDGDGEVGVIEEDAKSSGNENDDDSSKSDEKRRSSSPSSTTLPSSSKPKKLSNLFTGYKSEKVCQICEKPGDTVRCRGPCAGTFHVECVQKLAAAKDTDSAVNSPPRRGRRKKSSLRPTGETTTTVESTKNDAKPEPTVVNKTEEPVTSRRSRRSIATANTSEDSGEKSKNDESVKPTPRRSRRMEEKIKKAVDKDQQNDEEVKSEPDNSAEEKMETEDEPISNSEANVDDESSAESAAKDGEVSKEPSTNDDEVKQEIVEDPEQSAEIENNNVVDEVKTEKIQTEVSVENEIVDEKPDCNGDASEEVEVVASSSRKSSAGKSVESQNTTDASKKETSTAKNDKSNGGSDFMCNLCSEGIMYPCFACGETVQDKTGETERFTCHLSSCARVFHKECLKSWPQATWTTNNPKPKNGSSSTTLKETLLCPQHYCHTCISDNPAALKNRQGQAKLVRCIKCPTTYHQNVYCIPAGSELLTMSQIICPRHYVPPKLKSTRVNTSWCFICCIGGSLICCEECPMSFHVECLQLSPEEYEGRYLCEDCQSGRYLLYGEIVWVKLGHYRWWPAHILYPQEIPDKIAMKPHNRGEFAVRFFGSHDYYWVNRGRAFVYQEGDSGKKNYNRTVVDLTFEKALKEAEEAYQKLKIDKALREEEAKLGLKPPRYVRIKSNKPIGNVKVVELNTSNIPECRCDPSSERPCAPESDCLNRILLVECNPRVCAAGERCLNQAFEKRVYPPLMPCRTDKRGWGLKTLVDIKKGDFIIEYVGEMIDEEEYKKRVGAMYKNLEENYYFLTIDNNRMLDAGPKGNVSRFMNHSCDPNCETQKWTVNGDTRIGLFALKDITANDELVFNYNLTVLGNEKKPCLCGSEKCSGFIGMKAVKNGNGNNGGGSNGDDDSRKKSNDDNRDSKNGGGNGSKSSRARKKGRKLTAAGKRKRKAAMAKRASTAAASSSTLPIKKRKLSTKAADTTAETSTNPDESSKQNPQQPDTDEKETNPVEQSSTDELVKTLETNPTSATTTAEEDQPIAASSPKGTEKVTNEGEKNTTEYGTDEEHTISLEDIETMAETTVAIEVPKTDVSDENTTSVTVKSSPKRRGRKKGTVVKKKVTLKGRPKKKVMPKRLLKRGKKIIVKKTKKTTDAAKKSPKIKMKTDENRVVGKRGRKPHLTDQDKELALYKTLKKRLHKKLRAMVGLAKLEEDCFMCKEKGELIFCDNKKCSKGYHIPCVKKLFQLPRGRWLCPWHYCTECKSKCRVAKCSRCINSFCRLHTENNVYITCEDTLICKDHKSEYLADKLQSFVNVSDTSTDNDSSNITDASTQIIDPDSLLIPLRIPQPKPRPKLIHKPPPPAILHHQIHQHHHEHLLPPFIKIKEEALSDVEIDSEPDRVPAPAIVGESRNVARRSKKLFKKLPSVNESSIDDMIIDDFIEVHHVESYEVSGNEASNDDAKSIDSSVEVEVEVDEEYEDEEEEEEEAPPETNTADESDDDYLDVEMEEIQDDSS
ncbi:uncharacterized protein NSD [Planococcus citri]|uniref:uncharacterized protein NSD n=1 Tax=Planococcus citri TaxID=170843 RepID=UPI0031F75CBC